MGFSESLRTSSLLLAVALLPATSSAAWLDPAYQYKLQITIPAAQVSGSHVDFPLLVTGANLPAEFFANVAKTTPDDIDIVFSDAAETVRLKREVVSFDRVGRTLEAWVRLPTLTSASDTFTTATPRPMSRMIPTPGTPTTAASGT